MVTSLADGGFRRLKIILKAEHVRSTDSIPLCSKWATCAAAGAEGAAPDVRAGANWRFHRLATAQHAAYRLAQPAQRKDH